jgi:hypothetical protein
MYQQNVKAHSSGIIILVARSCSVVIQYSKVDYFQVSQTKSSVSLVLAFEAAIASLPPAGPKSLLWSRKKRTTAARRDRLQKICLCDGLVIYFVADFRGEKTKLARTGQADPIYDWPSLGRNRTWNLDRHGGDPHSLVNKTADATTAPSATLS